jgi:hypothetical protein
MRKVTQAADDLVLAIDEREDDLVEQLARRREAALRLPPLACGCHDPDNRDHQAGRCRYGTAA